ncbi:hypothetical protein [Sphingomonas sp. SUN039]|uniref:hypothetical protein n=1 Tax=Sphingomonas sp. SUN039 TaxID=2937787 RepID=UPI0021648B44|nr:hypothetical protein [Sphingomonas sp. SUN039]UVO52801.1 hypothetical protein M0209_01190 [Sphingomonas sp. SUN039]
MTDTVTKPRAGSFASKAEKSGIASSVSRFALGAVGGQIDRVSSILTGAADSIDEILGGNNSPLPDSAKGVVTTTSGKLRELADRATEEEALQLIEGLQRSAARHPAVTAGVGAALGAALGLALARLGPKPDRPARTVKPATT